MKPSFVSPTPNASTADTPPLPDKSESAAPGLPALEKHRFQRWHQLDSVADARKRDAAALATEPWSSTAVSAVMLVSGTILYFESDYPKLTSFCCSSEFR